jgi:glycosyltransferase involved in cell wall biosynthesis
MNTVRYAQWMHERGYRVVVFAVASAPIAEEASKRGLHLVPVKRNAKYFDFLNASRLSILFRKHGVQLVWFRDTRDMDTLAWAKRFTLSPFKLLYQQAMQFTVNKRDIIHTLRFSAIDAWVSTLSFLQKQVELYTRFPKSKIHVVPLGVDTSRLHLNESLKLAARDYFQLDKDAFVFGVIGRIDPLKGQHLAIEALHRLRAQHENVQLLIVGESTRNEGKEYEASLRKLIEQLNLQSFVHIRPYTADVFHFYHAIDAFLLCSKGETFGTVTIEAMAMGLPIVGTNSSGTPELLDYGSCGMLVDPEYTTEWSMAMEKIVTCAVEAQQMGIRAKNRFNAHYSKEASVEGMDNIVKRLLHSNR